jgi:GNAT superfamily N-acetyltransferase
MPSNDLLALARRLELTDALAGVEYAATLRQTGLFPEATSLAVGGGYATFAGTDSPISQAFGLGLHGPLPAADLDRLERFFLDRGAPAVVELAAPADRSLAPALLARGFAVTEKSQVLVRRLAEPIPSPPVPTGVVIRRAEPDEIPELSRTVLAGFFDSSPAPAGFAEVMEALYRMPTASPFVALRDGGLVGGGVLMMHRRVASLGGAATLPAARGLGIQRALIAARLVLARESSCDTAMVATLPDTASYRNAVRVGFAVAYGREKYTKNS